MMLSVSLLSLCRPSDDVDAIKQIAVALGMEVLPQPEPDIPSSELPAADILLLDEQTPLPDNLRNTRVLLMTDKISPSQLGDWLEQGISDFILLPLDPRLTRNRLAQQLKWIQQQHCAEGFARQTIKLRELGKLVGLVGHEIASPLGNVNTTVSFMLESSEKIREKFEGKKLAASELDKFLKQLDKALQMCEKNGANAGAIIAGFRSVAGHQCLEKDVQFYLHRYIDDIVLTLKSKLKKLPHEVHVVVSESIEMTGDAGALSQVVSGLIDKSITHGLDSNTPGKIIINATKKLLEDLPHIMLDYIDDGKGMSAEVVSTLFDNKDRQPDEGLTTAMIKKLVEERLHGTLSLQTAEGEGVHYSIVIPQRSGAKNA